MPGRKIRIMIADDDSLIRTAIQRSLAGLGFEVSSACDGAEASVMLAAMTDAFPQLLITDMDMPGHTGDELAEIARRHRGDLKVLFTSGEPQPALVRSIAEDVNSRFLQKPFGTSTLLETIEEIGVV